MIDKMQNLKGKTKSKFFKNISKYYDEMRSRRRDGYFQFEEVLFSKGVQGISKQYHEMVLIKKNLQTKPQVKVINIKHYDLYYNVFKKKTILKSKT